jgi:hypothetical protein
LTFTTTKKHWIKTDIRKENDNKNYKREIDNKMNWHTVEAVSLATKDTSIAFQDQINFELIKSKKEDKESSKMPSKLGQLIWVV